MAVLNSFLPRLIWPTSFKSEPNKNLWSRVKSCSQYFCMNTSIMTRAFHCSSANLMFASFNYSSLGSLSFSKIFSSQMMSGDGFVSKSAVDTHLHVRLAHFQNLFMLLIFSPLIRSLRTHTHTPHCQARRHLSAFLSSGTTHRSVHRPGLQCGVPGVSESQRHQPGGPESEGVQWHHQHPGDVQWRPHSLLKLWQLQRGIQGKRRWWWFSGCWCSHRDMFGVWMEILHITL